MKETCLFALCRANVTAFPFLHRITDISFSLEPRSEAWMRTIVDADNMFSKSFSFISKVLVKRIRKESGETENNTETEC